MITDKETNVVYLSPWIEKYHPEFFIGFKLLLERYRIPVELLENTADMWCRDYMPIQICVNKFVKYRYYPDYLRKRKSDLKYITDTDIVCSNMEFMSCNKTDLIIDGGNVVKSEDCVIMTEKVFYENPKYSKEEVQCELEELFDCNIIFLPWDKLEEYGHADGIVKPIDADTVLLTNYFDYDKNMAIEFERRLSKRFHVEKLHYETKRIDQRSWAYINFLMVGNHIFLPFFNIEEDEQAYIQISNFYPTFQIHHINAEKIVKDGGALNCITWNIKKEL